MKIGKIMVVEDSELLHRMYDMIFMRYTGSGTQLVHCLNGREALTQLNNHPDTDVIILDINMPVMSGLEFLQHCKQEEVFGYIPIIIVSTEGKEEDTLRGLKYGAKGYVTKPFQPQDLFKIMEEVVSTNGASGTKMRKSLAETLNTR